MTIRNLDKLFHPSSVAVVGGSQLAGSVGERVLSNILAGGFQGRVFAVNPHRVDRPGVVWCRSVEDLPEAPDVAVIVTPAATVPGLIAALGAAGTRLAAVISAGLGDGALRQAMLDAARPHLLRIVGPNSLGVLMPHAALNASFAPRHAAPGSIAFVSQSGALVTAMLDWASARQIGFSAVISAGDMTDVDFGDLIDLVASDPQTHAILLYVEGVTNAAKFMSAARAASRRKPIVAVKGGRSEIAGRAAFSHTRALAGAYDVYAAAFRRAGIVHVDSLSELFDAAAMLTRYAPTCGNRLAIVTNGGGAGVLAADAVQAVGASLPPLSDAAVAGLDGRLPAGWSRANPIDVVGDAHPERFGAATAAMLADPGFDAVLVIHCPTAVATGTDMARAVVDAAHGHARPVIACWLGGENARSVQPVFAAAGIAVFDNLDDAARGYGHLITASRIRADLLRSPDSSSIADIDRAGAQAIIAAARGAGRTTLAADEAMALLAAYGVPCVGSRHAHSVATVAAACAELPGPYAVKLVSPEFPHKTDIGGVALGLASGAAAVAAADAMAGRLAREHPEATITGFEVQTMIARANGREAIAGIVDDPTFGPVIVFGSGGTSVEVVRDRALDLPPLDDRLAAAMIGATRFGALLGAYRDVPAANRDAVVRVLNALAALAVEIPDIAELDINPLLVDPAGALAIDARVRLSSAPQGSRAAIRAAPMHWAADLTARSGLRLHVRPVRPDDEAILSEFFEHVVLEDLRFRFRTGLHHVDRGRILAMTQIDYRRAMNFLALVDGALVATAMLVADPDGVRAELAVSVRGDFKNHGVSWALVEHTLKYAAAEGIRVVESLEARENSAAIRLEREFGFVPVPSDGGPLSEVVLRKTLVATGATDRPQAWTAGAS